MKTRHPVYLSKGEMRQVRLVLNRAADDNPSAIDSVSLRELARRFDDAHHALGAEAAAKAKRTRAAKQARQE